MWPATTHHEQMWRRSVHHPPEGTYHAAVIPTIADHQLPPVSTDTGLLITQASTALVRLDATVDAQPAAHRRALVAAFTALEAVHSSALEHITTTPAAFYTAALTDIGGYDLAADNAAALTTALTTPAATPPLHALNAIHSHLLGPTQRVNAGRWRAHQVWIGPPGSTPQHATYVPPIHTDLPAALDDLAEFATHTHGAALATLAISYAHLEAIHPYSDGNGRAGRAWISHLATRWRALTTIPAPLAIGLAADPNAHIAALQDYRAGNAEPIIALCASATLTGIAALTDLMAELTAVATRMRDQLAEFGVRNDSSAWGIVDYLVGHPVTTNSAAAAAVGIDRTNGYKALHNLADAGVVKPSTHLVRDRFPAWEATEVLATMQRHFP